MMRNMTNTTLTAITNSQIADLVIEVATAVTDPFARRAIDRLLAALRTGADEATCSALHESLRNAADLAADMERRALRVASFAALAAPYEYRETAIRHREVASMIEWIDSFRTEQRVAAARATSAGQG